MFKAWEKHVTGIMVIDDLEEREATNRFNEIFTELFKVVPKSNRRLLIDMLYALNQLEYIRNMKHWQIAYDDGFSKGADTVMSRLKVILAEDERAAIS